MLIIPAIDILGGCCVRLRQGKYRDVTSYSNDPVKVAKDFAKQGAKYLHLVDLDGAKQGITSNFEIVMAIRKAVTIPIQIGGGIRNFDDAFTYLNSGIDRVVIGSSAILNVSLIGRLINEFGSERIVVSMDVRDDKVMICGWEEKTKIEIDKFLLILKKLGVKLLCVTDISKDGMMSGPNFELIKKVLVFDFKVIAAGGICSEGQLIKLEAMGTYGAIIGKAVCEGRIKIDRNYLTKRIIPCMDVKDGRVVKGIHFANLRDAGDPVELAKFYSEAGADELVFLDISATVEERNLLYGLVEKIARAINIPFTVGGGIKSVEEVQQLLCTGADKVSIGSKAVLDPSFITDIANQFGTQCIVISLDCKKATDSWELFINGGGLATEIDALKFAVEMEKAGAGELLINSLDRDGTGDGYDIELLKEISKVVNIPIIASSGAGSSEDFLKAFNYGCADAALAATLFHFGKLQIPSLKKYLSDQNITIRI